MLPQVVQRALPMQLSSIITQVVVDAVAFELTTVPAPVINRSKLIGFPNCSSCNCHFRLELVTYPG